MAETVLAMAMGGTAGMPDMAATAMEAVVGKEGLMEVTAGMEVMVQDMGMEEMEATAAKGGMAVMVEKEDPTGGITVKMVKMADALFTITSITSTAPDGAESGKTGNKPPDKQPRSRQINFTRLHSHAARCITPDLVTNEQRKPYFWQISLPHITVVICITSDYTGDLMPAATSIRLDEELKDRLKTLADDRHRSAHALMLEAITEYIDREEKRSQYLRDGQAAWHHYQETGLHLTAEEAEAWISTWGTENEQDAPPCHR